MQSSTLARKVQEQSKSWNLLLRACFPIRLAHPSTPTPSLPCPIAGWQLPLHPSSSFTRGPPFFSPSPLLLHSPAPPQAGESRSSSNAAESRLVAQLVARCCTALSHAGRPSSELGVICFYRAQVAAVQQQLQAQQPAQQLQQPRPQGPGQGRGQRGQEEQCGHDGQGQVGGMENAAGPEEDGAAGQGVDDQQEGQRRRQGSDQVQVGCRGSGEAEVAVEQDGGGE